MVSNEYKAALEVHSLAFRTFHAVRQLYRARRVSDAEFLTARDIFDAATAVFDAAFNKEREGNYETGNPEEEQVSCKQS